MGLAPVDAEAEFQVGAARSKANHHVDPALPKGATPTQSHHARVSAPTAQAGPVLCRQGDAGGGQEPDPKHPNTRPDHANGRPPKVFPAPGDHLGKRVAGRLQDRSTRCRGRCRVASGQELRPDGCALHGVEVQRHRMGSGATSNPHPPMGGRAWRCWHWGRCTTRGQGPAGLQLERHPMIPCRWPTPIPRRGSQKPV